MNQSFGFLGENNGNEENELKDPNKGAELASGASAVTEAELDRTAMFAS